MEFGSGGKQGMVEKYITVAAKSTAPGSTVLGTMHVGQAVLLLRQINTSESVTLSRQLYSFVGRVAAVDRQRRDGQ